MTQTSGSGGREAKYTDSHLLVVLPGYFSSEMLTRAVAANVTNRAGSRMY
jgi:hypothetical protein